MHLDDIKLDPEFQALFAETRLSGADREHLRNKLITEGFHDPLVLWNGVLLDGYTRLEICREEGIEPATRNVELRDREHAIEWIRIHQHSRRNLDPRARDENIAAVYEARKRRHGERGSGKKVDRNDQSFSSVREKVAAELGVSPAMVQRAVQYKHGLEVIQREDGPEAMEAAKALPMEQVRARLKTSRNVNADSALEPHQEVVRKLLEMARTLDASEKVSLARELFRIAKKWGLQRR